MFLEERISEIESKVDRILIILGDGNRTMSVKDIAEMLHVSRQALYTSKRYLLPDFGRGLKEGRKYTRSEVLQWNSKGEKQLYEEWRKSEDHE